MKKSFWKIALIVAYGILLPQAIIAEEPPRAESVEDFGLTYLPGESMQSFEEFVTSHTCLSGWWDFKRETETHWIGDIHYSTDNVRPNDTRYVTPTVSVPKIEGLELDLSDFQYRSLIVVVEYTPEQREQRGNDHRTTLNCRLVAHSNPQADAAAPQQAARFLFRSQQQLSYGSNEQDTE